MNKTDSKREVKKMEKKGFIQNGTKRMFRKQFSGCAYIYTDGIVLREERQCKSGKETFKKSFTHLFPCNIPIYITHKRMESESKFTGRLVVSNPSLLIDGINHVEIYFGNASQKTREIGIQLDTVHLYTQSGMEIRENIFSFISGDITIQNEAKQAIMAWDTLDGDTIWYGDKPEKEITHSDEL